MKEWSINEILYFLVSLTDLYTICSTLVSSNFRRYPLSREDGQRVQEDVFPTGLPTGP